jgi:23S rRNA (uracil1939-C5)-methyltransferase
MIERGARLTLDIDKPAAGGRMLARHAGQVVLVAGTIPGERVVARVERIGRGVAFAEAEEILAASPDRRPGAADWRCGGTVFSHVAYSRQLVLKGQIIQDAFARIGRLPLGTVPDVVGSPEQGYRMRARLHVVGDRIGFFREGTHELCDAAATGQLLPATVDWMTMASRALKELSQRSGSDRPLAAIAGVELAENVAGTERAVHLDLHERIDPEPFAALSDGLVGLSAQAADARRVTVLTGAPEIVDDISIEVDGQPSGHLTLRRDVRAFFQGNRFLLQPLVDRVVSLAGPHPVVDLYAGVGLFGLSLASTGVSGVMLVEGDPISSADLARNAAPFGDRVSVHRQSVESFLSSASGSSGRGAAIPSTGIRPTFIVDPPRTGMTRDALAGIITHQPPRIVYVSCDVATLARDARTLIDAGWELTDVTGIDLFPNTAHVESIAVFAR